jgi:hypothetical protein
VPCVYLLRCCLIHGPAPDRLQPGTPMLLQVVGCPAAKLRITPSIRPPHQPGGGPAPQPLKRHRGPRLPPASCQGPGPVCSCLSRRTIRTSCRQHALATWQQQEQQQQQQQQQLQLQQQRWSRRRGPLPSFEAGGGAAQRRRRSRQPAHSGLRCSAGGGSRCSPAGACWCHACCLLQGLGVLIAAACLWCSLVQLHRCCWVAGAP